MPTSPEQIDKWLLSPRESGDLEFKRAAKTFDLENLYGYCVAIANERGGKLILGVTDAMPRRIVGTQAFESPGKIEEKILDKLGFEVSIEEVMHSDGRVIVCHIPSRPTGVPKHLEGRYLMRSGERTVAMSPDRLAAIINEGRGNWLFDGAIPDLNPDDVVRLLDTQCFFDLMGLPLPAERSAVIDRLEHEKLIKVGISGISITNLGALLFAKKLDDFGMLARKAARVIVYNGVSKVSTKREQTGAKGYAVAFQGLVDFVDSQTPANEVIGSAFRKEVRMFPAIMLRETIANALIHQDLEMTGVSVMIEIYSDRIEVSNPGTPCVQVERFIDEYRSRNEVLADLMRRLGVCEEKGSGIDKVIEAAEFFQLPAPDFRVDSIRTTCVLYGQRPFAEMTREDRIRACYQHCVLNYVTRRATTNQTLRLRFGLPADKAETVSRVLSDSVEAGLIKRRDPESGSKKFAQYLPYWG